MSAGFLFLSVVFRLPLLAVLVVGLVLVGQRSTQIGARSTLLARLGLAALILDTVAQTAWSLAIPQLVRASADSLASFGMLSGLVSVVLSLLMTFGIALLIAAVTSRAARGPAFPEAPTGVPPYGGPAGYFYPPHQPSPAPSIQPDTAT